MEPKQARKWELLISAVTVIITAILMFAYYNRWFSFAAHVGPFRIIHYIAFAGTLYIAFGVILFAILRRRSTRNYKILLRMHTFGNLLSFLLVSIHFAGQLGRPADRFPQLGTGLALYIGMVSLVATGLALRFRVLRSSNQTTNRFVHAGLALAFYIIIFIHILHGLNII